jgi:hypothetical protein
MNNNPKLQVSSKFNELFGSDHTVEVEGERVKGRFGGYFLAELRVGGLSVATSRDRNWRTAYKLLRLEVEKLYTEGYVLISR